MKGDGNMSDNSSVTFNLSKAFWNIPNWHNMGLVCFTWSYLARQNGWPCPVYYMFDCAALHSRPLHGQFWSFNWQHYLRDWASPSFEVQIWERVKKINCIYWHHDLRIKWFHRGVILYLAPFHLIRVCHSHRLRKAPWSHRSWIKRQPTDQSLETL